MSTPVLSRTKVPLPMLAMIPDGYYAVRPDTLTPYTFLRLSRPDRGRWKGRLKVQSRHAEVLETRWAWNPAQTDERLAVRVSSQVGAWSQEKIEDLILLMIVDHRAAGRAYAKHIRRCHRCNTKLTDERSRHYGFGPECEHHLIGEKDEIDDEFGGSYEQLKARGYEFDV